MGKTYKRNSQFRPKKQGRTFSKDNQPWKKNREKNTNSDDNVIPPDNKEDQ